MYLGRIAEIGPAEQVMEQPRHPYTKALLAAVPRVGVTRRAERPIVAGEPPDPANPPPGCAFHNRCPQAMDVCKTERPELARGVDPVSGNRTACHLYAP